MKLPVLLLAIGVFGMALLADDKVGALSQPLPQNGDITIQNVGVDSVTPRIWVALGSNTNFKVVCQVYYTDLQNPDPSEYGEIKAAESMDRFLNLGVAKFLEDTCANMSANELVEEYRNGHIREIVMMDIIAGLYDRMDELNASDDKIMIDAIVDAVSMRAVGPFAEALAE